MRYKGLFIQNPKLYMSAATSLEFLTEITHGDKKLIKEMAESILLQVEEYLPIIQEAVALGDYKSVLDIAHKLKTPVKIIGADNLYDMLSILQVNPSDPYISEMVVTEGYNLIASIKRLI